MRTDTRKPTPLVSAIKVLWDNDIVETNREKYANFHRR